MKFIKIIKTDEEAIQNITKILNREMNNEEWSEADSALENYVPGISKLMYYSDEDLTSLEILKIAREENKSALKITTDEEAIEIIKKLYAGDFQSEKEWNQAEYALEEYQSGISNEIMHSKVEIEPEEALRLAREKNKPIIL